MKETIHAVSNGNLEKLIENLELKEDLASGKLHCCCCGSQLSMVNIGCIYPMNNEVRLCCNSLADLLKSLKFVKNQTTEDMQEFQIQQDYPVQTDLISECINC